MESKNILLDTNFLIYLNDSTSKYHENAKGYWEYYLTNNFTIYLSTIVIAEYLVKGSYQDLKINKCKISTFTIAHAQQFGNIQSEFVNDQIQNVDKTKGKDQKARQFSVDRMIYAQAVVLEANIITNNISDFNLISNNNNKIKIIDLSIEYGNTYGVLF
ncbi:MAG: hypothetical protein QM538_06425 [Methylacidiphilales bacterium]|nr:hypothetical protein [Candidatus Methylacidiphilales bacterium]